MRAASGSSERRLKAPRRCTAALDRTFTCAAREQAGVRWPHGRTGRSCERRDRRGARLRRACSKLCLSVSRRITSSAAYTSVSGREDFTGAGAAAEASAGASVFMSTSIPWRHNVRGSQAWQCTAEPTEGSASLQCGGTRRTRRGASLAPSRQLPKVAPSAQPPRAEQPAQHGAAHGPLAMRRWSQLRPGVLGLS